MMKRDANKIGDHDYVTCVKPSHKYVLTICDKVYQIENQSFAGSEKYAGSTGKATGTQAPNLLALWPWAAHSTECRPASTKEDSDHLCQSWQLSATRCTWPYAMFWEVLWALILGFFLSAIVQAVVSKSEMKRLLPDDSLRSLAIAALLGAASLSCAYAAVALARSIFRKGANFTATIVFQFASTNLVTELGITMIVLMGWQFAAAEFLGTRDDRNAGPSIPRILNPQNG